MTVSRGVVVVRVAVKGILKAIGIVVRGDVVMPLGQMNRRHDESGPREHQPKEGQDRGEGSKTTHSFDAMSRVSSTATELV